MTHLNIKTEEIYQFLLTLLYYKMFQKKSFLGFAHIGKASPFSPSVPLPPQILTISKMCHLVTMPFRDSNTFLISNLSRYRSTLSFLNWFTYFFGYQRTTFPEKIDFEIFIGTCMNKHIPQQFHIFLPNKW